jgi:oligopeptidase B
MRKPIAAKHPHIIKKHDDIRIDEYYWLNQRENPEVISYLEAENDYFRSALKHTEPLQQELLDELKNRLIPDDASAPVYNNGFYYYHKFAKNKEYPIYCRFKNDKSDEQILLDVNELARNHAYYQVADLKVSPDNQILCYAEDTVSRRIYTLKFKNLVTGQLMTDSISDTSGDFAWANDGQVVFYTLREPQTLRAYKVMKHQIGTSMDLDQMVYEEMDPTFMIALGKSRSGKYIFINNQATLSTETWMIDADNPHGELTLFHKREYKHEYTIDHQGDRFLVLSNWDAQNFRLLSCSVNQTSKEFWSELIPVRTEVLLESVDAFQNFIVLTERKDGINQFRIIFNTGKETYVTFDEVAYMAFLGRNFNYNSEAIRIVYSSPSTPTTDYDFEINTESLIIIKEKQIPGNFDKKNYRVIREFGIAEDGTKIPITLFYNKQKVELNAPYPLLLYGYGSYGYSIDPYFNPDYLSLLDRGMMIALAHVRGGQEMGRAWYDDGKLLKKMNTFTDFIKCAEQLINAGYTSSSQLMAIGGSAGGLLIGAVINLRPTLFRAVVAAVPFVDVVTTMLDDTIPLTTFEYDEWGNPNDPIYYSYMKSYSPYDNLQPQSYPAILVTAGLHDSQVQYWEPAKYVAKLRTIEENMNPVYLYTEMTAGHSGASGRYERYFETSKIYAFLLDQIE